MLAAAAREPGDPGRVEAALAPEVVRHIAGSGHPDWIVRACALARYLPDRGQGVEVLQELLTENALSALVALAEPREVGAVVRNVSALADEMPGRAGWAVAVLDALLTNQTLDGIASSDDAGLIGCVLRSTALFDARMPPAAAPSPTSSAASFPSDLLDGEELPLPPVPDPPPALPPELRAYLVHLEGGEPPVPPPAVESAAVVLSALLTRRQATDTIARSGDAGLIRDALAAVHALEPTARVGAMANLLTDDATHTLATRGHATDIDDALACARCLPPDACATATGSLLTHRALVTLAASESPDHIGRALEALDLLPDGGSRCPDLLTRGAIRTVVHSGRASLIAAAAFAAARLPDLDVLAQFATQGVIERVEASRDPHAASLMALAFIRLPDGTREAALAELLTPDMSDGLRACADPVVRNRMAKLGEALERSRMPQWQQVLDGAAGSRGGAAVSRTATGPPMP